MFYGPIVWLRTTVLNISVTSYGDSRNCNKYMHTQSSKLNVTQRCQQCEEQSQLLSLQQQVKL
jgi:hypothetical protein